jgi:hypothetical protein
MPATRTHKITVTVTFNKPISRANALREIKDSGDIYSQHYTSFGWQQDDERKYPTTFKLRGARIAKEA